MWPCISACCLLFLRGGGGAAWGRWAREGGGPSAGPWPSSGLAGSTAGAAFYLPPPRGSAPQGKPSQRGGVAVPAASGLPLCGCRGEGSCAAQALSRVAFRFMAPLLSLLWEDLLKELNASFVADFKVC